MNTSGSLNIRANADSNAEVVGQLEENAGGSVIEYGSQWCKIKSGKVTGFVATSYILIGDDARKALKANGYVATIKTDTLKVRSERNTDSSILGMVGDGEKFKCKKVYDKWIKISYEGKSGYLSKEFVSLECEMTYAKTMSQIQAERETEAPTEAPTVETPTEPIVAEEPETQPAASKNNRIRPNRTIKTDATKVSYDDKYLLACLVACEAGGETYEGKLAVANVVLNRVKSSSYPNSIKDVIYQRGQFGPVSNSSLDKMLKNGPDAGSTKAANAALGGTNNVPGFLSFGIATSIDTSSLSSYQIIDSQVFY